MVSSDERSWHGPDDRNAGDRQQWKSAHGSQDQSAAEDRRRDRRPPTGIGKSFGLYADRYRTLQDHRVRHKARSDSWKHGRSISGNVWRTQKGFRSASDSSHATTRHFGGRKWK